VSAIRGAAEGKPLSKNERGDRFLRSDWPTDLDLPSQISMNP